MEITKKVLAAITCIKYALVRALEGTRYPEAPRGMVLNLWNLIQVLIKFKLIKIDR